MLIYSKPFYIRDNGNGYEIDVRDAICSSCHKSLDQQQKYRGICKEFSFSSEDKRKWKYCPYCGETLYK